MDKITRGSSIGEAFRTSRSPERFCPGVASPKLPGGLKFDAAASTPSVARHRPSQPAGTKYMDHSPVPASPDVQLRESRSAWSMGRTASETMRTPRMRAAPEPPLTTTASDVGACLARSLRMAPCADRARSEGCWLATPRTHPQASAECCSQRRRLAESSPRESRFGNLSAECLRSPRGLEASASPSPRQHVVSPHLQESAAWGIGGDPPATARSAASWSANTDGRAAAGLQAPNPLRRRLHSGRITETSANFFEHPEAPKMVAATSVITNSQNYQASRGKRMGLIKEENVVYGRLQFDETQMEPKRSQKRHGFLQEEQTTTVHSLTRSASAVPTGSRCVVPHPQNCKEGELAIDMQQKSSVEMYASLKPDYLGSILQQVPVQKYQLGHPTVEALHGGRRTYADCSHVTRDSNQVRRPQTARASAPDQRNSDSVREHFLVAPGAEPLLRASVPVIYASNPVHSHSSQKLGSSVPPSSMSKDTAYVHAGLSCVGYIPRTPGTFSPHVPRVPVRQILSI